MRVAVLLTAVATLFGTAGADDILVNFQEGYKGKVYYQEFMGNKRRIVNWRLLEFDLEEKVVREVATFRTFLIRSDNIAKMSRDRRGLYVVGAPAEAEDFSDYSLIIMAWNSGREVFEVRRFITIPAAFWEHLTVVYLDWENALRINFFKLYTKHIEEWRRQTGAGEEDIFWDDCFWNEYETYAGSVALTREPVSFKLSSDPGECIDAVSHRYSYFITEKNGDSYIARKANGGDETEFLVKLPRCRGLEYVVLDGENTALVSAIFGHEKEPVLLYCDFAAGETSLSEARVLYENPSFGLTPVQSPYFPGVLVENVRDIGPEREAVREIMVLDAVEGDLHKLFEFYQKRDMDDYYSSGVVQWVPGEGDPPEIGSIVNNYSIYHRPSHKGRPGLVP